MKYGLLILLILTLLVTSCQQQLPDITLGNISNLEASPAATGIELAWQPASEANCYYIYRIAKDDNGYSYWGVSENTSIIDRTIKDGALYTYRVYPAYKDENYYHRSEFYLESNAQRLVRKPELSNLTYTVGGAFLQWEASSTVEYYKVERLNGQTGNTKMLGITPYNQFIDRTAQLNRQDHYLVTAIAAETSDLYKNGVLISPIYYQYMPAVIGGSRNDLIYGPDDRIVPNSNYTISITDTGLVYIEGDVRYERIDGNLFESEPSVWITK